MEDKVPTRLAAWFARQSLPRFLGLLFGNGRELERLLEARDREIDRLREDVNWYRSQYVALTDSFLLSRGNRPVGDARDEAVTTGTTKTAVTMAERLAADIEVEKMMELLIYQPTELNVKVEGLIHSTRPRDKEVLRRFQIRLGDMPESNDGVVVAQ